MYFSVELKTLLWRLLDSILDQCSSDSIENKAKRYAARLVMLVKLLGEIKFI